MANPTLHRRHFALASAAVLVGCRPKAEGGPGPAASAEGVAAASAEAAVDGAVPGLTATTFAEADRLTGVRHPAALHTRLAREWSSTLEALEERRRAPLPNSAVPASVFDPRPPSEPAARRPSTGGAIPAAALDPGPLPADPEALAFAPVTALRRWLDGRSLTAARLTDVYIERLKRIGPRLECVITLTEERARREAAAADRDLARGLRRGPLQGIPYGAKDLLDTAGIPTTYGAEPYRTRVPARDAEVVRRLAEAGAILVAKLSLGELANGDIWFGGKTRNPWNVAEGSSGSSAGAGAAVGAGLVAFAIGSETMGSIVSPSNRCGVVGLRPTFGLVPRTGAMALAWSLDKLGPMTRRVDDAFLVLTVIAGADGGDPASRTVALPRPPRRDLRGLRVGFREAWKEHPVDARAFAELAALGAELVPITLPALPYEAFGALLLGEAGAAFEDLALGAGIDSLRVQDHPECWPVLLRRARYVSAVDFVQADRERRRAMDEAAALFRGVDLIAAPAMEGTLLTLTNLTGHPCLVVRAGFEQVPSRGFDLEPPAGESAPVRVPRGFGLWGRIDADGLLCAAGALLEARLGVADERPPAL